MIWPIEDHVVYEFPLLRSWYSNIIFLPMLQRYYANILFIHRPPTECYVVSKRPVASTKIRRFWQVLRIIWIYLNTALRVINQIESRQLWSTRILNGGAQRDRYSRNREIHLGLIIVMIMKNYFLYCRHLNLRWAKYIPLLINGSMSHIPHIHLHDLFAMLSLVPKA